MAMACAIAPITIKTSLDAKTLGICKPKTWCSLEPHDQLHNNATTSSTQIRCLEEGSQDYLSMERLPNLFYDRGHRNDLKFLLFQIQTARFIRTRPCNNDQIFVLKTSAKLKQSGYPILLFSTVPLSEFSEMVRQPLIFWTIRMQTNNDKTCPFDSKWVSDIHFRQASEPQSARICLRP